MQTIPHAGPRRAQHRGGMTLPELLTCLAILAVLLAVAYPPLLSLLARQQVAHAADRLVASLALARTTAMAGRHDVFVMTLPGHDTLDAGWRVVGGPAPGGAADGRTLSVVRLGPTCLRVGPRQTGAHALRFTAVGYSRSELGGFQALTFVLRCRDEQRQVRLGALGRIRQCTPGRDADCAAANEGEPP